MEIPEPFLTTLRRLVEADPEVAKAVCMLPHNPEWFLRCGVEMPYCGCFIGMYAWMWKDKRGRKMNLFGSIPELVAMETGISRSAVNQFGMWCSSKEQDDMAVQWVMDKLAILPEHVWL